MLWIEMEEQELTPEEIDRIKNSNEVLTTKVNDLIKRVEVLEK